MTVRLLIGVPTHGDWDPEFGMALAQLTAYLAACPIAGEFAEWSLYKPSTSLLPEGRERCAEAAMKSGRDLVFFDTDMDFPRDTVHRMVAAKRPIVAANCAAKMLPSAPTARRKSPGTVFGEKVYTDPDSTGHEQVDRIGAAVMYIRNDVLKAVPRPRFEILWRGEDHGYQGEDWRLCELFEQKGYKPHINHELSKQIGHWGKFRYSHEHIGEVRRVDAT